MKLKVLMLLTAVTLSGGLHAQQRVMMGSPEERAKATVKDLSEKISLAPEKKDSLTTIFQTFYERMRTHVKERDKEGVQTAMDERDAQVKALLSDEEQFREYTKFLEERQSGRRRELRGGGPR